MSTPARHVSKGTPLHGVFRPNNFLDAERLRLRHGNLLVLLDVHTEQTSDGGLVVLAPKYVDMKTPVWGTAVAVGSEALDVKPGARILVEHALCGDALMIDGHEHRIICEDNVLGVEE